ncbi:hypothetical protein HPB52_012513 [Rhipicephalus sanguineus]|uniref:Tick transposon n=1 Tax=Rhipicephalus sanguineus TaxID=34632 RepID=A0A9D4PRM8_RHISA|nr:hypothetical protein HPB52_012513 [Rhipicephalus sanguineus]
MLMSVANKYGRRILEVRLLQLILDQQPLREASNLRALGLEIHGTGSAGQWVKSAKQQVSETMHFIRRIAKKSGGANSNMARLLVHSVLQPRLVYRAQFYHLTLANPVPRQANAHVSRLLLADNLDAATVVAYTYASLSGTTIHTALVCPLYLTLPDMLVFCGFHTTGSPY